MLVESEHERTVEVERCVDDERPREGASSVCLEACVAGLAGHLILHNDWSLLGVGSDGPMIGLPISHRRKEQSA